MEEVEEVVVEKSLAKGGEAGCKSGEQVVEGGELIQTRGGCQRKKKKEYCSIVLTYISYI